MGKAAAQMVIHAASRPVDNMAAALTKRYALKLLVSNETHDLNHDVRSFYVLIMGKNVNFGL